MIAYGMIVFEDHIPLDSVENIVSGFDKERRITTYANYFFRFWPGTGIIINIAI